MAQLYKMSRKDIDNSLRDNEYAARILHAFERSDLDLDGLDRQLEQISTGLASAKGRILGTRPVRDGDTHISHRFNPTSSGASEDIGMVHKIEVAQSLLGAMFYQSDDSFYERMGAAIQGQKLHGAGPTFATSLMRMHKEGQDPTPKDRFTVSTQFL